MDLPQKGAKFAKPETIADGSSVFDHFEHFLSAVGSAKEDELFRGQCICLFLMRPGATRLRQGYGGPAGFDEAQTGLRSAGFQTCRIADFQIGWPPQLRARDMYGWPASLETRDQSRKHSGQTDLEVCATRPSLASNGSMVRLHALILAYFQTEQKPTAGFLARFFVNFFLDATASGAMDCGSFDRSNRELGV